MFTEEKNDFDLRLEAMADDARREFLAENAADIEDNFFYMLRLSDTDLADCKTAFVAEHKLLLEKKEAKKEAMALLTQEIKEIETATKELLLKISTGAVERRGTVYHLEDAAARLIVTYDEMGTKIGEKRMKRGHQMSAFTVKTGTQD